MAGVERIEVLYPSRKALLGMTEVGAEACRLLLPSGELLPAGTRLEVAAGVFGEAERFDFSARVLRFREDLRARERTGLWAEVERKELPRFARFYAWASGRPPEWGRRGAPRYPVDLKALLRAGGTEARAALRCLSRTGAFVVAPELGPQPNQVVRLRVSAGLFRSAELEARVVGASLRGQERGFGVEFLRLSERARAWLAGELRARGAQAA